MLHVKQRKTGLADGVAIMFNRSGNGYAKERWGII
jgi:hypothetical protein